ncbi:MAG: hypothetical protein OXC40_02085, partial [Proteobacteria bacterium]|nr:hypothetical protein [Pseudomonadota bacterium]
KLAFQALDNRWYLHHFSTLGDEKVLYWYPLSYQGGTILFQSKKTEKKAPWYRGILPSFGPDAVDVSTLHVFGSFEEGSHLLTMIPRSQGLNLLFRTGDRKKNYSVCQLFFKHPI